MMKAEMIEKIVDMEWPMFHSVNEGGPKASCQQEPKTFYAMRKAQFFAWNEETVNCYYMHVLNASLSGRNLVMEKYIHMMKYEFPEQYEKLIARVVFPSEKAVETAEKITEEMIAQTDILHKNYPNVADSGRPLYATEDYLGFISVETYQKGELYTYNEATLDSLYAYLMALKADGKSLARMILENSVMSYGFESLEAGEKYISGQR